LGLSILTKTLKIFKIFKMLIEYDEMKDVKQLERDWEAAANTFGNVCKEGQTILIGWKRKNEDRITIYTLEREQGKLEKYIRVWDDDKYPNRWDYIYYP